MLALYYEAEDVLSLLYSVDFGLGQTKYDVLVRRYSYHKPMDRKDPYVVIEELGLPDGVPAWPRLRPMNNGMYIDLYASCVVNLRKYYTPISDTLQ